MSREIATKIELSRIAIEENPKNENEIENEARMPAGAYRSQGRYIRAYPGLWRPFTKQLDDLSEW